MTNRNNKGNNKIKLNDDGFNKIPKLYNVAMNATSKVALSSGGGSGSLSENIKDSEDIEWHNLQEHMDKLEKNI